MKSFDPRWRTHRALFISRSFLIVTIVAGTIFFAVRNNITPSSASTAGPKLSETTKPEIAERYGRLEMSFEENQGQTDKKIKFLSRGRGYDLFLTTSEVVLSLHNASALRLTMIGANRASSIEGDDEQPGKVNYLIGNNAEKWRTNIPTYRKVRYREVYPGVDVVYYGNHQQLEYDFEVAPGRDPGVIKFKLEGANRIKLDDAGNLRLAVRDGEVRLHKPFIYQITDAGQRSEVKGEYVIKGKEIGFKVRAFDSHKPLVIDPILSYATLLGAAGDDSGNGIAVDTQGNAYVTGVTSSATFPTTPGAFQTTFGGAFVTKLDATGSNLIYSTYLGGTETIGTAIAVDSAGSAYVTGSTTASPDFPIVKALKTKAREREATFDRDAFVVKLNPSGSGLLFSTHLGGSDADGGNGIALDSNGNIYVAGQTTSSNFPVVNAIKSTFDPSESCPGDGFVTKINPAAPAIVFSTYLGGNNCDRATAVATDAAGDVYVTGDTTSTNFPTASAFQSTISNQSSSDAFATKFSGSGSLIYSTYLGGNGTDTGHGIAVDVSNNAYVTGVTTSTNYPTANAIQATNNGPMNNSGFEGDVFVTKLNSAGSALVYSTYLGGSDIDTGRAIAVDATGNAYLTGSTFSLDFPLVAGALRTRSPLFRTTDGTANWHNDTFGLRGSVFDIAVHPTQPAILYAATNAGVFESTNSGKTWSAINNGLQTLFVNQVIVDPATPSRIYAVISGPDFSTTGIYRSIDSGNTWTRTSNGINSTSIISLAIDPSAPATLYAGAFGRGIYKSTNGADSWALQGDPRIVNAGSIAVDPFNHSTVYATDFNLGVFRSLDAGATWQRVGFDQTGPDGHLIAVSPLTPGLVYVTADTGLFRSVDGGTNWSLVRPLGGRVVFDPANPSTVYLASFTEGILKSSDNGQTWIPMNKGRNNIGLATLAIDPVNPSILYLGSSHLPDNDAFVTKINPSGSALVYSTFLGGESNTGPSSDEGFAIAIDSMGNAYVTGVTNSPNFVTTPDAYQPINFGPVDAFIAKLVMSHIISGQVLDESKEPLTGAEVVLSDGALLTSVFTDSIGYYEFVGLREGGSFTVTASKANFTMAPASQTFNNLTSNQVLNFTATPASSPFFTISGQVTENGAGLPGVTVTLSGSQQGLRTTDGNGNYSFTLASGGNYTVTPSLLDFTFTLSSQTFLNLSSNQTANFTVTRKSFVVTNKNNHGAGSLRQAILDANATPGKDTITFNIPGAGVQAIELLVSLPNITDPVVIDAITQPGYSGSPLIELNGTGTGGGSGLLVLAGNSTIRGLAFGGFNTAIVLHDCHNNIIQGNYIGLDATGTISRPNGSGLILNSSSNNLIGGTTPATRNVISSNEFDGLSIIGSNNLVQGNFIGTNAAGTVGFGNGFSGITVGGLLVFPSTFEGTNNVIGGTVPGAGNLISFNGGSGVLVSSGTGNSIRGNSIFSNHNLGIDLFLDSVTANDHGDPDTGPNLLQNFPLLTSVDSNGGSTTIQGTLNSTPNTKFQIDFYSNSACDPGGNGEGETFFSTTEVTTGADGNATIDITFPIALPSGRALTATATDPQGNTSEFSPCDASTLAGSVEFSVSSRTVIEDIGSIVVTVLRKGGSFGTLAVDYSTANGTAIAGQDYTSVSGTLIFSNGETSKSLQIQINNDTTPEPDETFAIRLNASNLASLGVPNLQTVTLQDRSTVPSLSIENALLAVFVNEGDNGTTDAVFTVKLSAETGRSVGVDFAVSNGSSGVSFFATGGAACGPLVDYETQAGTLLFQPGDVSQTVTAKVCGDTNAEDNEEFVLNLSNPSNATMQVDKAVAVIVNDDVLLLALDESGPAADQAAAIESHLVLRDPFYVPNIAEWLQFGSDRNTRVTLFAVGLQLNPGEQATAVVVDLFGNGQSFFIPAEDVRAIPDLPFTQVTFRLPDNLSSGVYQVAIRAHGNTSNTGTIRVAP